MGYNELQALASNRDSSVVQQAGGLGSVQWLWVANLLSRTR